VQLDAIEALYPTEVDDRRGSDQARFHQREKALAAGQRFGIVTVLGEDADHVGHRFGSVVFKRSRFHRRGL
jgi:hypothetical protein